MALRKGYKKTDIGIIPEDWDVIAMGSAGTAIIGLTYSPRNVATYGKLVHRSSNIQNNKLAYDDNVYVNIDVDEKLILKENDILICVRNGSRDLIGKSALIRGRAIGETFGAFMSVFRTSYHAPFIYQLFISNVIQWQINESLGATINQITNKTINEFKIPVPKTFTEQTAIATVLNDTDALITSLEKLIEKKQAIKQGVMQELLEPKKGWDIRKVSEIGLVGRGRVISHKEISRSIEGLFPVYSSQTSNNGIMGYIDTYDFDGEYITWTTDGENAGTVFYRNGKFNCTNVCGVIKIKTDNPKYLTYVLNKLTPQHVSKNLANPKLMNEPMKQIEVPLPPIEYQNEISQTLHDIDSEIISIERNLNKFKMLKQGMMQELLLGNTRLL